MARKTVDVESLRERANSILATSHDDLAEKRRGVIALLEAALFSVDNYHGYRFLPSEFLPAEEQTSESVLREGYDETRRYYIGAS